MSLAALLLQGLSAGLGAELASAVPRSMLADALAIALGMTLFRRLPVRAVRLMLLGLL